MPESNKPASRGRNRVGLKKKVESADENSEPRPGDLETPHRDRQTRTHTLHPKKHSFTWKETAPTPARALPSRGHPRPPSPAPSPRLARPGTVPSPGSAAAARGSRALRPAQLPKKWSCRSLHSPVATASTLSRAPLPSAGGQGSEYRTRLMTLPPPFLSVKNLIINFKLLRVPYH